MHPSCAITPAAVSIRRRTLLAAAIPSAAIALPALAQMTPNNPIRLVVSFPPGGSTDVIARLMVEELRARLRTNVLVENRPGAAGRLGLDALKSVEPDGSMIVLTPSPMISLYPLTYKRLGYDPVRDLKPVAQVASYPLLISVGPAVPSSVVTIKDYLQWVKADPSRNTYGVPAAGSTPHFVGVMLSKLSGVPLSAVAYKGDAPTVQDVLGGHIAMGINVPTAPLAHVGGGRLRVLAVTGARRMAEIPQVPTLTESGFPEISTKDWTGAFVSGRTPPAILAQLEQAFQGALSVREVREGFAKQGIEPDFVPGEAFGRQIAAEIATWGPIVKASGFTSED